MEEYTKLEKHKQLQKRVMEATGRKQNVSELLKEGIIAFRFKENKENVHNDFNRGIEEKEEKFNRAANQKIMEDTEQLLTMMSNVLDAIKEGQKASQEVAKQVEKLKELKNDMPAYVYVVTTISDRSCELRKVAMTKEEAMNWMKNHAQSYVNNLMGDRLEVSADTITFLDKNNKMMLMWCMEKVELIKSDK